jgi:ABC-type branched-subunit amino acid transport system substrate-binding protein
MIAIVTIFTFCPAGVYAETGKPAEVTIGVILPFSSAFEAIAAEQKNAIELAIAESNYPAEVIYKDGRDDAEGALEAFDKLTSLKQPPLAMITCASWVAEALHPRAAGKNIFHMAIGSAAFQRTRPGHTVRFTLDAKLEERQLANYLTYFKSIAIYYMDNGYGNSWAETIQDRFSGKVVASVAYDPDAEDFTPGLERIKQAEPEVLVLLSAGNAALIARQARRMNITAQLVGTRPIERPELLEEAEYTEGLVYTYPSYDTKHPMVDRYQKTYGAQPTIFASEAYDAMSTLLQALADGRCTPEQLFDWYAGRTYTGALGEVTFDQSGDAVYPYMYKEVAEGRFQVADFQFALLLEETRQDISSSFHEMHEEVEKAAEKLSRTGLTGEDATALLEQLYRNTPHSYDCVTVNTEGIIVNVAPEKDKDVIGADISGQEQIIRLHETHKPVVSQAIDTVEGFIGIDLEHPVFDEDGNFTGSVSALTEPDFFGQVISPRVANFPVEIWIMQKDGRILYDENEEEIGRNLFSGEFYADYPSLIKVGRKMAALPQGKGQYTFRDKKLEKETTKNVLWTTVALHGTEFRLALAYVESELKKQ